MAVKTQYLAYFICLADAAQVASLQAQYPRGIVLPPLSAAATYAAPFRGAETARQAPCVWTPWSSDGTLTGAFPFDVTPFTRKSSGFWAQGGSDTKFIWVGQFVFVPPAAAMGTLSQRRWVVGFEEGVSSAEGETANASHCRHTASRHPGGRGFAQHGLNNVSFSVPIASQRGGAFTPGSSWERLYVRLRRVDPGRAVSFWRCRGTVSPECGIHLSVTPTGALRVVNVDSASGGVTSHLGAANDLPVDTWVRLDLLIEYRNGGGTARFRLYKNGVFVMDTGPLTTGLGEVAAATHTSSQVGMTPITTVDGQADGSFANSCEIDLDDWINADLPADLTTSPDWLHGSKVVLVRPSAFGAGHSGSWVGDVRILRQIGAANAAADDQRLTTSTTAVVLSALTDLGEVLSDEHALGLLGANIMLRSTRGAASGDLGYSVNGAGFVQTAIVQAATPTWTRVPYQPAALTAPIALASFELRHTKGAGADAASVTALHAALELMGRFGAEDQLATTATLRHEQRMGQHAESVDPRGIWARPGITRADATAPRLAPPSPVLIVTGTYVGNGTGQDLSFPAPVAWFHTRPTAGAATGTKWWSSMIGAHRGTEQSTDPYLLVRQREDPTFVPGASGDDVQQRRYLLELAGNDAQANANAVTYQYVAFLDPGQRFCLNQEVYHAAITTAQIDQLSQAGFTPELALLVQETFGETTTLEFAIKGPGHAAASYTKMDGSTQVANALTFGAGQVTTQLNAHAGAGVNLSLSLWRRTDGNADPGEVGVVAVGSYVGDGAASRSFALGTGAGRRPAFMLIITQTGGASGCLYRDPSHTGTTSTAVGGGANAATGIIAGDLDGFQVGSAVNTNAVIYHYFILWGGPTAGNAGWSANGTFAPVEANGPVDATWPDAPEDPDIVPPVVPVTIPDDITTDLASPCLTHTTRVVNLALSHLGISKQITALDTDAGVEATLARLHYGIVLEAVLRDFTWPFCTRYADLVLVAGTPTVPVNRDWQYSYRTPTDMRFARRLVNTEEDTKRGYDPNPPEYRLGSDATGVLLFTDEVIGDNTPVQLEYTVRLDCPASAGDAQFRLALSWALAHALSAPLTRDIKKTEECLRMYLHTLDVARGGSAKEQQQPDANGDPDWLRDRN